jgi:hypothetical protein
MVVGALALALSACGSSSNNATTLLKQTFSGPHTVNSGNLNFSVTLNPSGSTTLTGPISLSFGGPFQSLGKGKLPQSNFNISLSAGGKSGSLAILSTGSSGYVTLAGSSYQLPQATFQKLESSFATVSGPSSGGSSTLSKLGINPLKWLSNPSVVGNESVAGTQTTHIRASVNVSALLADLNTFLQKASSLGTSTTARIPSTIPDATRSRIASEVRSPSFDVWTGTSDKTVRKLAISLTIPVSGQVSTLLGGLRTAQIAISMVYANLNQPQTIQAPASIQPFSQFATKLRSFLATVEGSVVPGGASGTTGSSTTGSAGTPANVQSYSQCIKAAGQDISKMQQCASLINGK